MSNNRKSGHATGMAGEFFVMERLFRKDCEPALTLGNAKNIDILAYNPKTGKTKAISVKAARGGGKWGVGRSDLSDKKDMVFVFLLYKNFEDLTTTPDVWVMSAADVEARKQGWLNDSYAVYYSDKQRAPADLDKFKDAWHLI